MSSPDPDHQPKFTSPKISRRTFLVLSGVTIAATIPSIACYRLFSNQSGTLPNKESPYVDSISVEYDIPNDGSRLFLVIAIDKSSDNPYGPYLGEILRTEGLNNFNILDTSTITENILARTDICILTEISLNDQLAGLLEDFVYKGGRLFALRPDSRISKLMGVEKLAGSTVDGYMMMDQTNPLLLEVVDTALQFHGTSDHYRLRGAKSIAWLADASNIASDYPAVTLHKYGQGLAVMWSFDLVRSIVYTRQGNPLWVNQERDGLEGIRACDMFEGWIDLERMTIPQADEQQRLLVGILNLLSQGKRPLPRIWYFPNATSGVIIITGDSHTNPSSSIEEFVNLVEERGGKASIYYTPPINNSLKRAIRRIGFSISNNTLGSKFVEILENDSFSSFPMASTLTDKVFRLPSPEMVNNWRARGHEFTLHPYVEDGVEAGWEQYWYEFTSLGYGPVSPTVRTHRVLWQDWVDTALCQTAYGIRMNMDYYLVGPTFINDDGNPILGHFTGSGLPMYFVDENGQTIKIYQQVTQLVDEHLLKVPWSSEWNKLGTEQAIEASCQLIERGLKGDYCAIAVQCHVDNFALGGEYAEEAVRWLTGILDYAVEHSLPIWSARQWLDFTETRHDARIDQIEWEPESKIYGFQLVSPTKTAADLTLMIPLLYEDSNLIWVQSDGAYLEYYDRSLSGIKYGCISVSPGIHTIVAKYQ